VLAEERRNRIVEILNEVEFCPVLKLVEQLEVSRATVVRDLAALQKSGVIAKVHGGAKLQKSDPVQNEAFYTVRINKNRRLKEAMAAEAARFVKDDTTIFIDSSTTCYTFARELMKHHFSRLNIVTNSPAVLGIPWENGSPSIIVAGGELNKTFNMLAGLWVIDFLDKINIDQAFVSASGISEKLNVTTSNLDIAQILNKVTERSNTVNLLVDSTKLCKREMINIYPLARCSRLITDDGISAEHDAMVRKVTELFIAPTGR
jgi:DeoR/GlpR family transcriptional regulator of sugar metabolism